MKRERLEHLVLVLVALIAGGIMLMVLMRHVLPVLLPFLIAWFVALAVRDPSKKLSEKTRIPERILRPVLAILITIAVFSVFGILVWQIISLVTEMLSEIGQGGNPIYDFLYALSTGDHSLLGGFLPPELSESIGDAIGEFLSSALTWVAGVVTGWAGAIPGILLFILITLVSLIYFSIDIEKINTRVRHILPKKLSDGLSGASLGLLDVVKKYLGSYLVILGITFIVMLLGLMLLGVDSAPTLALIIAFVDILPVVGVGTVLIPWSIFSFALGDTVRGVGLLLLFVVNTVIRECAEPRILGKSLGIHPLVSLILIYAGYELFGFGGLLLTPIIAGVIGLFTDGNFNLKRLLGDEKNSTEIH